MWGNAEYHNILAEEIVAIADNLSDRLGLSATVLALPEPLSILATTDQIVLGVTNTITLTAPAPAASRTYTIPDAGGAASFVMTAGAQTIGGVKSFTSAALFADGSAGAPGVSFTSGDTDTGIYRPTDDQISLVAGGVDGMVVIESGGAAFCRFADGTASLPSISFQADGDSGLYRPGNNSVGLTANGNVRLEYDGVTTGTWKVHAGLNPGADNSYSCGTSDFRWTDVRAALINGADYGFQNGWFIREYPATFKDVQTKDEKWFRENTHHGLQIVNDEGRLVMVIGRDGTIYADNIKQLSDLDPVIRERNITSEPDKLWEVERRETIREGATLTNDTERN
jgi:hypothetical protein